LVLRAASAQASAQFSLDIVFAALDRPTAASQQTISTPLLPMFQSFYTKSCQACHKRPAKIKFIKIHEGQWTEVLICQVCAQSMASEEKSGAHLKLDNVMEALMKPGGGSAGEIPTDKMLPALPGGDPKPASELICPSCGLSYSNYRPSLMLGCSDCYAAFEAALSADLRRIHGHQQHKGRRPARMPQHEQQRRRGEFMIEAAARVVPSLDPEVADKQLTPESDNTPVVPVALDAPDPAKIKAKMRELKRRLDDAIGLEEFAEAAGLRDQIKKLDEELNRATRQAEGLSGT